MSSTFIYTKNRLGTTTNEPIPLSTKLILEQAESLGVSWSAIPNTRILKLEYAGRTKYFRYQISSETSYIGFHACLDKGETKSLLEQAGLSTPKGVKLEPTDPETYWLEVFHALPKPLVVKPSHGLQGLSICMGITEEQQYLEAVSKCFTFTDQEDSGVIVEETFVGKEYRLLTSREKVLAALYREPANVVGDGTHTITELIDQKNSDPRRGRDLKYALFIIDKDADVLANIAEQGLSLDSVPSVNQKIFLRKISNIARGGDSIDITDEIHPSVREIAVKALRAIPELDFAGVDFMTQDIFSAQTPESYRLIEINSSPGLCIHELPFLGKKRYTDREFVLIMFPELRDKVK